MFLARCTPVAQLNARSPFRRTVIAVMSASFVAATFTTAFASRPAGGDAVSSLKSQAIAISQKIVLEQLQIGAYQQQYSVYSQKVASDQAAVTAIDQQIGADQQNIDAKTQVVRKTAVMTYMSAGAASSDASVSLFTGNANRVQAASEYSGIAVGNINTAVDQLHTARLILQSDQQSLQRKQAEDQSDLTQQSNNLSQADNTEQQLAGDPVGGERSAGGGRDAGSGRAAGSRSRSGRRRPAGRREGASEQPILDQRSTGAFLAATLAGNAHHERACAVAALGSRRWREPQRPAAAPVPPVRGAGRIRRQLRRGLAERRVHGCVPILAVDLELGGVGGRARLAGRRAAEPSVEGRGGHRRGRPLRLGWPATLAGRPLRVAQLRTRPTSLAAAERSAERAAASARAHFALGRCTRRVSEAVSDPALDDLGERRVRAERGGHEIADTGMCACRLGGQGGDVLAPVAAGPEEVRDDHDRRRAGRHARRRTRSRSTVRRSPCGRARPGRTHPRRGNLGRTPRASGSPRAGASRGRPPPLPRSPGQIDLQAPALAHLRHPRLRSAGHRPRAGTTYCEKPQFRTCRLLRLAGDAGTGTT